MTSRSGTIRFGTSAVRVRISLAACTVLLAFSALAQDAPGPGQGASSSLSQNAPGGNPPVTAAEPKSPSAPAPAVIDALGRWLEEGATKFRSDLQGAQETLGQLGNQTRDAAKEATGAVVGLPNTRILAARERCVIAQIGGPDCQSAAVALCRGKGFQTGKSLDTQSEHQCPSRLLLEGRTPNDSECRAEIFVTRAMCQ